MKKWKIPRKIKITKKQLKVLRAIVDDRIKLTNFKYHYQIMALEKRNFITERFFLSKKGVKILSYRKSRYEIDLGWRWRS